MSNRHKSVCVGVVGIGFGQQVLVPAFRRDARADVAGLAASTPQRAARVAKDLGIARAFAGWRDLVDDPAIDAVAIAVPPAAQAEIAIAAIERGKAVFCEKPLAASLGDAEKMMMAAEHAGVATTVDFMFPEIAAWREAKRILDDGGIGNVRHAALHWNVETYANRKGLDSWKARRADGGGVVHGFLSHAFHYMEWLFGPVTRLSASLFSAPGDTRPAETFAVMALVFASGIPVSVSMGADAFLGNGHRLEIYGEDGALVLDNPTADYAAGFRLAHGTRKSGALEPVAVDEPADADGGDGRIVAVARLAERFLNRVNGAADAGPGLAEGLRVQRLMDAAFRSDASGAWADIAADGRALGSRSP